MKFFKLAFFCILLLDQNCFSQDDYVDSILGLKRETIYDDSIPAVEEEAFEEEIEAQVITKKPTRETVSNKIDTFDEGIIDELTHNPNKKKIMKKAVKLPSNGQVNVRTVDEDTYNETVEAEEEEIRRELFRKGVIKKKNLSVKSRTSDDQKLTNKIKTLISELKEARNRLMLAESEVERLSGILEARHENSLGGKNTFVDKPKEKVPDFDNKTSEEMSIATVIVEKANIRTGPGVNNSPLMTVSKNTRLTVETRHGKWFRIITPTGARAWISKDVVRFGKNSNSSPSKTVQIEGYDPEVEAEALELFRKRNKK